MVVDPNMIASVIGASASMLAITVALLALIPTMLGMVTGDRVAFFEQVFARDQARLVMRLLGFIVSSFSLAMLTGIMFFFVTCEPTRTIIGVASAAFFALGTLTTCIASIWFIIRGHSMIDV